jgi:hypothetical protein
MHTNSFLAISDRSVRDGRSLPSRTGRRIGPSAGRGCQLRPVIAGHFSSHKLNITGLAPPANRRTGFRRRFADRERWSDFRATRVARHAGVESSRDPRRQLTAGCSRGPRIDRTRCILRRASHVSSRQLPHLPLRRKGHDPFAPFALRRSSRRSDRHPVPGPGHRTVDRHRHRRERRRAARCHRNCDADRHRLQARSRHRCGRILHIARDACRSIQARGHAAGVPDLRTDGHRATGERQSAGARRAGAWRCRRDDQRGSHHASGGDAKAWRQRDHG